MLEKINSIKVNDDSIVYIACPANFATGGPEALHQLAAQLRGFNVDARMVYYCVKEGVHPVHPLYEHYNIPVAYEVENINNNIILAPESEPAILYLPWCSNMRKVVWWLSVRNYLNTLTRKTNVVTLQKLRESNISHIAHSHFSLLFLGHNRMEIAGQISDYMSDVFYASNCTDAEIMNKENIVIYNANKNGDFLEKIKKAAPEIKWIAIQNMYPMQVADLMKRAKVYIDFGYHPGKERMPREAGLQNCCLIVGKKGSACVKEDMPILDKYHFEFNESVISDIISLVKECFNHYERNILDFAYFKDAVSKERENFARAVKQTFIDGKAMSFSC